MCVDSMKIDKITVKKLIHHIHIRVENKWMMAFKTPFVLCVWLVCLLCSVLHRDDEPSVEAIYFLGTLLQSTLITY